MKRPLRRLPSSREHILTLIEFSTSSISHGSRGDEQFHARCRLARSCNILSLCSSCVSRVSSVLFCSAQSCQGHSFECREVHGLRHASREYDRCCHSRSSHFLQNLKDRNTEARYKHDFFFYGISIFHLLIILSPLQCARRRRPKKWQRGATGQAKEPQQVNVTQSVRAAMLAGSSRPCCPARM